MDQNSTENADYHAQAEEEFRRIFPGGHRFSLRSAVRDLGCVRKKGKFTREMFLFLNDLHPRAFDLITTYGKDYRPWPLRKCSSLTQPVEKGCFGNSLTLMRVREPHLQYVEGIVIGVTVQPMLHAWNTHIKECAWAIDWTHYRSCKWSRYLGIPFSSDEYNWIWRELDPAQETIDGFFAEKNFPAVEELIQFILQKRLKSDVPKARI